MEWVSTKKGNIWILSDFNFLRLSWGSEHTATIRPGCRLLPVYKHFLSCLDDFGLVLVVSGPIRGVNIFDMFLAPNHTLVNITEILPGISDHDITFSNVSVKLKINQQKPETLYLKNLIGMVLNLSCMKNLQKFWLASKRVQLRKSGMLLKVH